MAYDDALAARVRQALSSRADVVEKAMFGLTFMVAGNMCCGVNRSDLIIRLDGDTTAEELQVPHVRAWDFMKRPMRGIFAVAAPAARIRLSLIGWIWLSPLPIVAA